MVDAGDSLPIGQRNFTQPDLRLARAVALRPFPAADDDAPLIVYIGGDYWQRGDRKDYSFVARELNASGITVAIPSYSLCPAVSVMEIGDEIQLCLAALWKTPRNAPRSLAIRPVAT